MIRALSVSAFLSLEKPGRNTKTRGRAELFRVQSLGVCNFMRGWKHFGVPSV